MNKVYPIIAAMLLFFAPCALAEDAVAPPTPEAAPSQPPAQPPDQTAAQPAGQPPGQPAAQPAAAPAAPVNENPATPAAPAAPAASGQPPYEMENWSTVPEGGTGGTGGEGAEKPAETGQRYMEEGEAAYTAGDYDKAQKSYEKAIPLLEGAPEKSKAHERLAFIFAAFDQADKVYSEFVEALKLDHSLALDPDQVSPKIYSSFLKARDVVVREGSIVCDCDPAGAEVYLNDVLIGEAPVKKEHIPEGEYTLTLKKWGWETTTGKITIKKDVTLTVEDKLPVAKGEITVRTFPAGARVVFAGNDVGATPLTIERITSGSYTLSLKRDYFEPQESMVTLKSSERVSIDAALKRRLLFIGIVEGEVDQDEISPALKGLFEGPVSGMEKMNVVMTGVKALAGGLVERGLDPAALGFLRAGKARLDLPDEAVLSGIMEKAGVELALVALLQSQEGRSSLVLTLYSVVSGYGDRTDLSAPDVDGLKAGVARYFENWKAQGRPMRATIGARLVDRAAGGGGGVEVINALPGFPVAQAGMIRGDLITQVDGKAVGTKAELDPLLSWPGAAKKVVFKAGDSSKEAVITPADSPVEAPLDSPDYLYNLDLVDGPGVVDSLPPAAGSPVDARAIAALNLGNAYSHIGADDKAIAAYLKASTQATAGICTGTALFRLGEAYSRKGLWPEAADSYRKAFLLYPNATLGSAEGRLVAPLAVERLMTLYKSGMVRERWWQ